MFTLLAAFTFGFAFGIREVFGFHMMNPSAAVFQLKTIRFKLSNGRYINTRNTAKFPKIFMKIWDIWRVGNPTGSRLNEPPITINKEKPSNPLNINLPLKDSSGSDNRPDSKGNLQTEYQILTLERSYAQLYLLQGLQGAYGWTSEEKITRICDAASFEILPFCNILNTPIKPVDVSSGGLFLDW